MTDSTQQAAAAWASKVNHAANDPARIEKRKEIPPAFTVPRRHTLEEVAEEFGIDLDELRNETHLSAETLAQMEASETKVPSEHAVRAKELRRRFMQGEDARG